MNRSWQEEKEGKAISVEVYSLIKKAYKDTGIMLQTKMPVSKKALQIISALDPCEAVRRSSTAEVYLKYAKDLLKPLVPTEQFNEYDREVTNYDNSPSITSTLKHTGDVSIEEYWGNIISADDYPILVKVAKALLSACVLIKFGLKTLLG